MPEPLGEFSLERMFEAVEAVKRRRARVVGALEAASVPHAVVGGHAVAYWVEQADEGGARNTPDVDILLRRQDFEVASVALERAGFVPRRIRGFDSFLDGPDARERSAIFLLYAGEKVRPGDPFPVPSLDESGPGESFRVVNLPALIRMKLTSYRLKDKVHLLDFIDVGLIDQSTVATVPPELASRLQVLIDNPDS